MKRISVLISAFNAEHFISDAIRSVLLQELPPGYSLEVIIGIDGCQKTLKSAIPFKRFGVRLIKMMFNYGPYITFNTMMYYSTGEIISRFDADDIMLPGYLKSQLQLLASSSTTAMTRTWSVYTDLNFNPGSLKLASGKLTGKDGKRDSGSDGQFMMKRAVWNALGSFKPWKCFADSDFISRSKIKGFNMEEIGRHLYVRRVHGNSLTMRNETAYNSAVRRQYQWQAEVDKHGYLGGKPLFVSPVTGFIDFIL